MTNKRITYFFSRPFIGSHWSPLELGGHLGFGLALDGGSSGELCVQTPDCAATQKQPSSAREKPE